MTSSSAMAAPQTYSPPTFLQALGELRAFAEIGSYFGAKRLLKALAPRGDGHPVMVLPGFMATDGLTQALRDFLDGLGYEVHAWEMGRNPGLRTELCCRLEERIASIRARTHRRVSLVGWSLGGIYARVLAHRQPDEVRQIVTLGSPFNVAHQAEVSGPVAKLYERLNPQQKDDPLAASGLMYQPPPVPSTSIFSERDGIAPWRCCVDACDEKTENISVPGSHCGMTHNPLMLYTVAERLSQREHNWRPFEPSLLTRLMLRPVCGEQLSRR